MRSWLNRRHRLGFRAAEEELATRLRVAVTRLNRKLRQQSLAGLSPAQASALGTVNRLNNPTLGELAAAEQVQPPTVTRLVTSLESAGLVARETDGVDRRVVRVRITAEGRRNLQRIRTLKNAYLTRRLAALDPAEQAAGRGLDQSPRAPGGRRMSPITKAARQTFKALRVRNYRLFFVGQVISASGTWMHAVALGLLVLSDQLHGNGFNVGLVTALQFLPMLLLGSWGGLIVDRVDKRRLLYITQTASGLLALALGLLVALGTVTMWEVYLISTLFGVVNLFDNPARQTFVSEMVGRDLMPNAISLNSVVMNSARVIGPAIGGILIFTVGLAACFLFNAASYVAVLVALFMMRPAELHQRPVVARAKGQVREGLRYVWSTRGAARSPAGHGGGGHLRLQFHDHPPPAGHPHLPRRRRHLQRAYGGHGHRRGHRRSHRRPPQPAQHRHAQRHRPGLRRHAPGGRRRPDRDRGHRGPGLHGGLQHLVHLHRQRDHSAAGRPGHAWPGHGALRHRLPRQHAHWGAAGGLDRRRQQPTGRHHGRRSGDPGRLYPPRPSLPARAHARKQPRRSRRRSPMPNRAMWWTSLPDSSSTPDPKPPRAKKAAGERPPLRRENRQLCQGVGI